MIVLNNKLAFSVDALNNLSLFAAKDRVCVARPLIEIEATLMLILYICTVFLCTIFEAFLQSIYQSFSKAQVTRFATHKSLPLIDITTKQDKDVRPNSTNQLDPWLSCGPFPREPKGKDWLI